MIQWKNYFYLGMSSDNGVEWQRFFTWGLLNGNFCDVVAKIIKTHFCDYSLFFPPDSCKMKSFLWSLLFTSSKELLCIHVSKFFSYFLSTNTMFFIYVYIQDIFNLATYKNIHESTYVRKKFLLHIIFSRM